MFLFTWEFREQSKHSKGFNSNEKRFKKHGARLIVCVFCLILDHRFVGSYSIVFELYCGT